MASVQDLGKCTSEHFSMLFFATKTTKRSDKLLSSDTHYFQLIIGMCVPMIECFVFSIMAGLIVEMLFVPFSVYNAL